MNVHRILNAVGFLLLLILPINSAGAQVAEFKTKNGITVIVHSMPQATGIGIEAGYEVGFIDEPEKMVQASHLLEHLVCFAAGAGFEQKKAFEWLNQNGMANAETLPDWTHYDYVLPAENLDKALEIEASRLQQTDFDRQLLRSEAKRVYLETDAVEGLPASGMVKHAFMAIAHALRYGSKNALVRGGLDDFDNDALVRFYERYYQPRNLTLVISGNTTVDEAKKLVEKHLGTIKSKNDSFETKLDWSKIPGQQTVAWDAKPSAVCIVWKPPADPAGRLCLTALSTIALNQIASDKNVQEAFHMVMTSNNGWFVGDLPLFAYGSVKPGQSLDDATTLLRDAFETNLRKAAEKGDRILPMFLGQFNAMQNNDWDALQQQSAMLQRMGRTKQQSQQLILAQDALNRLMSRRLLGPEPQGIIQKLNALTANEIKQIVETTLSGDNRHVVHVVPQQDQ